MEADKKHDKDSWRKIQNKLAEESGLAVVLVEDIGLSAIAESNNNSICEVLTKSEDFSAKCEQFCGRVFNNAVKENKALKYKCHAGLECIAVPVEDSNKKKLVAITGRTFSKSEDYRKATERAISGDWNKFPPTKFFGNVLITSSEKSLEKLAKRVADLSDEERSYLSGFSELQKIEVKKPIESNEIEKAKPKKAKQEKDEVVKKKVSTKLKVVGEQKIQEIQPSVVLQPQKKQAKKLEKVNKSNPEEESNRSEVLPTKTENNLKLETKLENRNLDEANELAEWRSLFNSMLKLEYKSACGLMLEFLKERYDISSLAWLENKDNRLRKILAIGSLETQKVQISMAMDDSRLRNYFEQNSSIELKERNNDSDPGSLESIRLFPIKVGGEIRSALAIGEKANDPFVEKSISKFSETVAFELEILRLREELTQRSRLDLALKKFNESLKMIDSEDFWSRLMRTTAELLQAERGSVLVYDDKDEELVVKAAIGRKSDVIKKVKTDIGKRIAMRVWESGKPLVVPSIQRSKVEPAPAEWKYQTESFISFPIAIGDRVIGVLNIADKVDRTPYQEFDLQLLRSIVPQIAVAIDHASLKNKAGEFEQLSVTDSLTGLLNRRYLEERLGEEIKRSNRHGYPMSFMMIDVDDFKSYNDKYLHPEGDKALRIVGQCLRETLRGADIAARYGGEEFSILLPQTTLDEAEIIAERIRTNIETTAFPHRQVTVSIGISCISVEIDTVSELIETADKALFEAKNRGKNNVQIFEEQRKELRLPN